MPRTLHQLRWRYSMRYLSPSLEPVPRSPAEPLPTRKPDDGSSRESPPGECDPEAVVGVPFQSTNAPPVDGWYPGNYTDWFGGVDSFNVVDFGAVVEDDETHNDSIAIQKAIDMAIEYGVGAVYIPRGVYNLHSPVGWSQAKSAAWSADGHALRIYGDFPLLKAATAGMPHVFELQGGSNHFTVQRLLFDGQLKATVGVAVHGSGGNTLLDQVGVACAGAYGFMMADCTGVTLRHCTSATSSQDGFLGYGCQDVSFEACGSTMNGRDGFRLVTGSGYRVVEGRSEDNAGDGIHVGSADDTAPLDGVLIQDGHIEANLGDGIYLNANNALVGAAEVDARIRA